VQPSQRSLPPSGAISDRLRELAENSNAFLPLGPEDMRIECARFVLWCGRGKSWNAVHRLRLAENQVEPTVEEVRALLRARGRSHTEWEISSSATPPNLVERLRALGMRDHEQPYLVPMVLVTEPPRAAPGVAVAIVETYDDFVAAQEVMARAFEASADRVEAERALYAARWAEHDAARAQTFVARLDGELVGAATASYLDAGVAMHAGSVLDHARGRGVYRALVRARWEEAVRRGTPALFTSAAPMSRPILNRVGFVEIGEIRVLLDEF
jgi:predicted N-acetyltransferase YhbS